jgi:hypothetical protein
VHFSEKKKKTKSGKKSDKKKSKEAKEEEDGKETNEDYVINPTEDKASRVGPTNSALGRFVPGHFI